MVPVMADILSESVKEKVTRIILATYRVSNQLSSCTTILILSHCCCKMLNTLLLLSHACIIEFAGEAAGERDSDRECYGNGPV